MAHFRILSFCGGGMRGLMSAAILQRLDIAFFDKHGLRLVDQADMFAGTSTGSVISGLLLLGVEPHWIVDFYLTAMREQFSKGLHGPDAPELPSSAALAKIDKAGLDRKLSSFAKKVLLTSFDIGAQDVPWSPQLFHNFTNSSNAEIGLFDAMSGSSAMVAMAPPHQVTLGGRQLNLVDGAFVHHDPTVPAIAAAASNGVDVSTISAIDIGTGFMENFISADTTQSWGANQWLGGDGGVDGTLPALLVNTPEARAQMPILNLCLNGTSTNMMPDLAGMLLPGRFAYLNPDFGKHYVPEDATDDDAIAFLLAKAAEVDLTHAMKVLDMHWVDAGKGRKGCLGFLKRG